MPPPATCTSPTCWRPRPGGCSATAACAGWPTEFGGNWLDFRRFEEHNSVDRGRFPTFNDELRRSMFEEPIRFFLDLVQNDRPVTEFLDGKHTFVNAAAGPALRHAGVRHGAPTPGCESTTRPVTAAAGCCRWPCSSPRTRRACGTSPVKRGYWVVRRLLGENIPAPPPNVPDLPATRPSSASRPCARRWPATAPTRPAPAATSDSTRSAWHSRATAPWARPARLTSAAGPSTPAATFPRGGEGSGVEGLRAYLETTRRDEFVDNLCRKLLAYGLGRTLIPSDDATVDGHAHAAGRRWRPLRCAGRSDRREPAIPEQADRSRQSRSDRDARSARAGTCTRAAPVAGPPAGLSCAGPA